jgi:hypothetical protein
MHRIAIVLAPFFLAACATSSATVAPSGQPTASPGATATPSTGPSAAPTATIASTAPPSPTPTLMPPPSTPLPDATLPPVFGPVTLTTSGEPVPNSDIGGCGSLWNEGTIYGTDDCGPHLFKLDAEPVVVAPGGIMTFAAPTGYGFSIDRIAASPDAVGIHSWTISIAPVSDLANLPEGQQEGITAEHGGRVLGHGDRAVISAWVKAPLARGEYLVELDASVNDGPWTFTWPRFFWRVSVQ